jgi:hypothetical protein
MKSNVWATCDQGSPREELLLRHLFLQITSKCLHFVWGARAALTQFLIAKKPFPNQFWKPKPHPMSISNIVNRRTEKFHC